LTSSDNNQDSNELNTGTVNEINDKDQMSDKEKAEKYFTNWQRAEADFINYKRRAEQEKSDLINYSNSNLLMTILPVLDDFERALAAIPSKLESSNWIDGIKLIDNKLTAIIKSTGAVEIEAQDQIFDPNVHEAVAHIEGNEGKILSVVQKGYKLKDRVLRPALVIVGKGTSESTEEQKPQ
jgi:molecular chaperone GrpE